MGKYRILGLVELDRTIVVHYKIMSSYAKRILPREKNALAVYIRQRLHVNGSEKNVAAAMK